jgi:hypothetical protein
MYVQEPKELPPNANEALHFQTFSSTLDVPSSQLLDPSSPLLSSVTLMNTTPSIPNTVIVHSSEYDDDEVGSREAASLQDLNSSNSVVVGSSLLSSQHFSGSVKQDVVVMSSFMSPLAHSAVMMEVEAPLAESQAELLVGGTDEEGVEMTEAQEVRLFCCFHHDGELSGYNLMDMISWT